MTAKRLLLLVLVVAVWVLYAVLSSNTSAVPTIAQAPLLDTANTAIVPDTALAKRMVPKSDTENPHVAMPETAEPAEKAAPAACSLGGITFHEHAPGRDQLTFTAAGAGRLQVSGQINAMSVSGAFRVSGTALTAVPKAGSNILGGSLSMGNACSKLKGSLSVKSAATGKPVSLPVDLFDPSKGD